MVTQHPLINIMTMKISYRFIVAFILLSNYECINIFDFIWKTEIYYVLVCLYKHINYRKS